MKTDKKKLLRLLGRAIVVLSFIFLIRRLYIYRSSLADVWSTQVILCMIGASVLAAGLVAANACIYWLLLRHITGKDIPASTVLPIYGKTELYKYLPGNVMHLIGKNQIALVSDAGHAEVALCTIMEVALVCIGAVLAGLLCSFSYVTTWMGEHHAWRYAGLIVLGLAAAAAVLYFIFRKKLTKHRGRIRELFSRKNLLFTVVVIVYDMGNKIASGLLFFWLLRSMGVEIPAGYMITVAGIYAFAWLVGFITPGAPGGLGVREAMISLLLQEMAAPGVLTAAALINRIITIFADVIAFGLTQLFRKKKDSAETASADPSASDASPGSPEPDPEVLSEPDSEAVSEKDSEAASEQVSGGISEQEP